MGIQNECLTHTLKKGFIVDNEDIEYLKMQAEHGRTLIFDGRTLIGSILGFATILELDMLNGEEFSSAERIEYIQIIKDSAVRYQELMDGCIKERQNYHNKSRGE